MAVGKKGFSKEDELLLQDFSKNVSTKVIFLNTVLGVRFGFSRSVQDGPSPGGLG